jgi:hypothetical protein
MGQPVDSFGNTIDVEVNLREASSFVRFTGGKNNSLVVDGSRMNDTSTSHYHFTLETIFMDVFGIQKYFKSEFYFIVVDLAYP